MHLFDTLEFYYEQITCFYLVVYFPSVNHEDENGLHY